MNLLLPIKKFFPSMFAEKTGFGGVFEFEHRRDGETLEIWKQGNLVLDLGINHFLDTELGGSTPITAWYIGLYSNTYTPQAADTYSEIGSTFTELNAHYDESTRPVWTKNGVAAAKVMTNSSSRATFTFNQAATVSGAMFVSSSVKGDNSAGLMSAASAQSPARTMANLDELLVTYSFTGSSS